MLGRAINHVWDRGLFRKIGLHRQQEEEGSRAEVPPAHDRRRTGAVNLLRSYVDESDQRSVDRLAVKLLRKPVPASVLGTWQPPSRPSRRRRAEVTMWGPRHGLNRKQAGTGRGQCAGQQLIHCQRRDEGTRNVSEGKRTFSTHCLVG